MSGDNHNQADPPRVVIGGVSAAEAGRRLASAMRLPSWWADVFPPKPPTRRERFVAWLRGEVSS